jgi:hypothetical protein
MRERGEPMSTEQAAVAASRLALTAYFSRLMGLELKEISTEAAGRPPVSLDLSAPPMVAAHQFVRDVLEHKVQQVNVSERWTERPLGFMVMLWSRGYMSGPLVPEVLSPVFELLTTYTENVVRYERAHRKWP